MVGHVERKRRRAYLDLSAIDKPGLFNGLSVDIGTVATLVVPDPPTVFLVKDFSVYARALGVVEYDTTFPISSHQVLFTFDQLEASSRVGAGI